MSDAYSDDAAEQFEIGLDWYQALTDAQKDDRAVQWQAARAVVERERLARVKPVWADETARKYV